MESEQTDSKQETDTKPKKDENDTEQINQAETADGALKGETLNEALTGESKDENSTDIKMEENADEMSKDPTFGEDDVKEEPIDQSVDMSEFVMIDEVGSDDEKSNHAASKQETDEKKVTEERREKPDDLVEVCIRRDRNHAHGVTRVVNIPVNQNDSEGLPRTRSRTERRRRAKQRYKQMRERMGIKEEPPKQSQNNQNKQGNKIDNKIDSSKQDQNDKNRQKDTTKSSNSEKDKNEKRTEKPKESTKISNDDKDKKDQKTEKPKSTDEKKDDKNKPNTTNTGKKMLSDEEYKKRKEQSRKDKLKHKEKMRKLHESEEYKEEKFRQLREKRQERRRQERERRLLVEKRMAQGLMSVNTNFIPQQRNSMMMGNQQTSMMHSGMGFENNVQSGQDRQMMMRRSQALNQSWEDMMRGPPNWPMEHQQMNRQQIGGMSQNTNFMANRELEMKRMDERWGGGVRDNYGPLGMVHDNMRDEMELEDIRRRNKMLTYDDRPERDHFQDFGPPDDLRDDGHFAPRPPPDEDLEKCPIPGCFIECNNLRYHAHQKHIPDIFKSVEDSDMTPQKGVTPMRIAALRAIKMAILGPQGTFNALMDLINGMGINATPDEKLTTSHWAMIEVCRDQNWPNPKCFSLNPLNSPGALIHWRPLLFLLSLLDDNRRKSILSAFPVNVAGLPLKENPEKDFQQNPQKSIPSLMDEPINPSQRRRDQNRASKKNKGQSQNNDRSPKRSRQNDSQQFGNRGNQRPSFGLAEKASQSMKSSSNQDRRRSGPNRDNNNTGIEPLMGRSNDENPFRRHAANMQAENRNMGMGNNSSSRQASFDGQIQRNIGLGGSISSMNAVSIIDEMNMAMDNSFQMSNQMSNNASMFNQNYNQQTMQNQMGMQNQGHAGMFGNANAGMYGQNNSQMFSQGIASMQRNAGNIGNNNPNMFGQNTTSGFGGNSGMINNSAMYQNNMGGVQGGQGQAWGSAARQFPQQW